jgi:hypothetical protein
MRAFIFLLAAALALPTGPVDASQRRWTTLGSTNVAGGQHHSTIHTRGSRQYSQIRLCVSRNSLNINNVDVNFVRGGAQRISIHRVLRPGQCSFASTLRRSPQRIRNVWVNLGRLRHGGRSTIRVEAR